MIKKILLLFCIVLVSCDGIKTDSNICAINDSIYRERILIDSSFHYKSNKMDSSFHYECVKQKTLLNMLDSVRVVDSMIARYRREYHEKPIIYIK